MPQLIAMVIVVVGAMIYMFQTFGGTGDKIEGIAQKTSIITEINNIKDGVKIAAKSGQIAATAKDDKVNNLKGLASLSYFAEQINAQLTDSKNNAANANIYNAISFGGGVITAADNNSDMQISLVTPAISGTVNRTPGIFVDFSKGGLKTNAAFLESQIANDLSAVAFIDRTSTAATAKDGVVDSAGSAIEKRTPAIGKTKQDANGNTVADDPTSAELGDGKFIIYFKDFGSDEVVQ
jgi:hypothetical protein